MTPAFRAKSAIALGFSLAVGLTLLLGSTAARAQPTATEAQLALDREVATLMQWLTGSWSNAEQISLRKALGHENRGTIPAQSYEIRPVDAPTLGENVLQVLQFTEKKLSLESYYIVTPDVEEHRVLIRVATPKNKASDAERGRSDVEAAALKSDDMRYLDEGCTSQWLRTGAMFRVRVLGKCVLYKDEKSGGNLYYQIDSALTQSELSMLTFNRDARGEIVWLGQGATPRIFQKSITNDAQESEAAAAAVARVRAWFDATYAASLSPLGEQFSAPGFGWTGSEMRVYAAPADIVSGYERARAERRARTRARQGELVVVRPVAVRDTSVIVYTRFTRRDGDGNLVEIADAHYFVVLSGADWKVAGIIVSKDSRTLAQ